MHPAAVAARTVRTASIAALNDGIEYVLPIINLFLVNKRLFIVVFISMNFGIVSILFPLINICLSGYNSSIYFLPASTL